MQDYRSIPAETEFHPEILLRPYTAKSVRDRPKTLKVCSILENHRDRADNQPVDSPMWLEKIKLS